MYSEIDLQLFVWFFEVFLSNMYASFFHSIYINLSKFHMILKDL